MGEGSIGVSVLVAAGGDAEQDIERPQLLGVVASAAAMLGEQPLDDWRLEPGGDRVARVEQPRLNRREEQGAQEIGQRQREAVLAAVDGVRGGPARRPPLSEILSAQPPSLSLPAQRAGEFG